MKSTTILKRNRRKGPFVLAAAVLACLLGASAIRLRTIEAKAVENSTASKSVTGYTRSTFSAPTIPVSPSTTGATYWAAARGPNGHDDAPGDGKCEAKYIIDQGGFGGTRFHIGHPLAYSTVCTLRAAIEEANAHPGPDTINFGNFVDDCTNRACTLAVSDDTKTYDGGEGIGEMNITDDLTINGLGAEKLILDGTLRGSFSGQNAYMVFGRIFAISNNSKVTINGLTLENGYAGDGATISVSGGSLTLDHVNVTGSRAAGDGGAIHFSGGTHQIRNCTFSNNTSTGSGGAVAFDLKAINSYDPSSHLDVTPAGAYVDGGLTISNSTFFSNTASAYGGVLALSEREDATISNSTFSGNAAQLGGGALYSFPRESGELKDVRMTLRSSTVSENTVNAAGGPGGGVSNSGIFDVGNTIIAGNNAALYPEISNAAGATVTSAGYNLIGSSNGRAAGTGTPISYQLTDILDTDPKLGPLQDNGGATKTRSLTDGSPAVDKGNSFSFVTDQRGNERPIDFPPIDNAAGGDGTDIGAYEIGGLVVNNTGDDPDADPQDGVCETAKGNRICTLRAAIQELNNASPYGSYKIFIGLSGSGMRTIELLAPPARHRSIRHDRWSRRCVIYRQALERPRHRAVLGLHPTQSGRTTGRRDVVRYDDHKRARQSGRRNLEQRRFTNAGRRSSNREPRHR